MNHITRQNSKALSGVILTLLLLEIGLAPAREAAAAASAIPTNLRFILIASGLSNPLFVTHAGDGTNRLFMVERTGKIRIYKNGALNAQPFLDLSDSINITGGEQGLLGLAFAPDAAVRRETSDATRQESRSPHCGGLPSVTDMNLTIHYAFLPHTDAEASIAFYRDLLGFEVRGDVGYQNMRWITVGPADRPGTSIVLEPPAADPGVTGDERRTIAEMMAKGTYASINLAAKDLDGAFERVQAGDAEVVQEPTEQPYGVRDCAVRDPAGNLIRIQELR